jgi:cell division cycle protein 37
MSKLAFDYDAKWGRLDVSDDEETFHPGLDKNLNIRVNRMTRDRKEEEIDEQKKVLEEQGEFEKAAKLESLRPLHQGNACRVTEERTIINRASNSTLPEDMEAFTDENYILFRKDNKAVLDGFTEAGWEESRNMLIKEGDILLMHRYADSYFMLEALNEELQGNRERVRKLCHQSQIISNIHRLAQPLRRPPRDLVPAFFEKFESETGRVVFQQEVDNFVDQIAKRAVQKKAEQAKDVEKQQMVAAAEAQGNLKKERLVDAMYTMSKEERLGPGGLDPVEVFESLPEALQCAFKAGDIEMLQEVAMGMDEEEFDQHLQKCIDSGLWKDG